MTVCVPEPLIYGLLIAAVGRDLTRNGGLKSIIGKTQDPSESRIERERQNDHSERPDGGNP